MTSLWTDGDFRDEFENSVAIALIYSACDTTSCCDEGWTKAGDKKCFKFIDVWTYAKDHCSSSELARIENREENDIAQSLIPSNVHSASLGFKRPFNFPSGFTRWNNGEPNGSGIPTGTPYEACVEMYRSSGLWNDVSCWIALPAICSKPCRQK
ncbi:low affinity immunoglobulin epsilon Fc receptor-like [Tubulanus polymorphus]|uniref:low affinity immunoglobulin epsilon Fc receptor-like n=1 Tax=Tubulanus polymorphus TaxID=672921 RepID=UPI003DA54405